MIISRRILTLAALFLLAAVPACGPKPSPAQIDPDLRIDPADPSARYFEGLIISFRPILHEMIISTGHEAPPNPVRCKYDRDSHFFLDGQEATLDKLERYMPVKVRGQVRDDYFYIQVAKFSSQLPPNIHRGEPPAPATQDTRP